MLVKHCSNLFSKDIYIDISANTVTVYKSVIYWYTRKLGTWCMA